ncbi:MAG: hypothetical protein LBI57_05100 [Helicobacteraceae bacterium]|jgi:hypothetical protein|nr:hypothetical protein [Helicobacteraceae bacterium]
MNKEIEHTLVDIESEKMSILHFSNKKITVESGKNGKLKSLEKVFPNKEDAEKYFEKKEWELLKKGFVLQNADAPIGKPILHYFVGNYYTGALSFEQTPKGIYIYKANGADAETDDLILIDIEGKLIDIINLPGKLAWDIQYNKSENELLFDLDHYIYKYNIIENKFNQCTKKDLKNMTSFISVSNNKIAFSTNPIIVVTDISGKKIFDFNYDANSIKGSIPFCSVLSKDGSLLAFHNKISEIAIHNANDGKIINKINGNFEMAEQMEFTEKDKILAVREQYGAWKMYYYNIETGKEIEYKKLEIPEYTKEVNNFCFNKSQTKLVLTQRNNIYVYDFIKKELLHSFKIMHSVKTIYPKFVGEQLGIRTDYGCFSIYNV